jgi:hypothetical protein
MHKRRAELIHKFRKGEHIVETMIMGEEEDVLIILTNKGVYKVDLTNKVVVNLREIKP